MIQLMTLARRSVSLGYYSFFETLIHKTNNSRYYSDPNTLFEYRKPITMLNGTLTHVSNIVHICLPLVRGWGHSWYKC